LQVLGYGDGIRIDEAIVLELAKFVLDDPIFVRAHMSFI
jgi:hypothetical protein